MKLIGSASESPRSTIRISFPLRRQSDYQLLEYACHEGNYSIANTLSGSRAEERK